MNDGQSNPGMDGGVATERVRRGGVRANTKPSHRKLARPRFNVHRAPTVQRVRNGAGRPRGSKPTSAGTGRMRLKLLGQADFHTPAPHLATPTRSPLAIALLNYYGPTSARESDTTCYIAPRYYHRQF
jgi:hypothetical protein